MTRENLATFSTALTGPPESILAALVDRHALADGRVVLTCPSCGASAVGPTGAIDAGFVRRSYRCPVFLMVQFGLEQFDNLTLEAVS